MSSQLPATNPTAYNGVRPLNPGNIVFRNRDPLPLQDVNNYVVGDTWMNPVLNHIFMLMRDYTTTGGVKTAVWVPIYQGAGTVGIQHLVGDVGVSVDPDGTGTCKIQGDLSVSGTLTDGILPNIIKITAAIPTAGVDAAHAQRGTPSFSSTNFAVSAAGFVTTLSGTNGIQSVTGDDLVQVFPSAGGNLNLNCAAGQGISTSGIPGSNEILITAANATTGAQKGVSKYEPTQFNVVAGLVSLKGNNPYLPCFSAYESIYIPNVTGNGAAYTIIFDSVDINQGPLGPCYNPLTGVFTVPVTGNYYLSAGCVLDPIPAPLPQVNLYITPSVGQVINSVTYSKLELHTSVYTSGIIPLTAGTTVTVVVVGSFMESNTAALYGAYSNYFNGYLVC